MGTERLGLGNLIQTSVVLEGEIMSDTRLLPNSRLLHNALTICEISEEYGVVLG
jgi:hypothetical protein